MAIFAPQIRAVIPLRGLTIGLACVALPIVAGWLRPWPYLLFVALFIIAGVSLRRALGGRE